MTVESVVGVERCLQATLAQVVKSLQLEEVNVFLFATLIVVPPPQVKAAFTSTILRLPTLPQQ